MRTMTDHVLELLKGPLPMLGQVVDFQAPFNTTQRDAITGGFIPKGRVVSLNSSGLWQLGVGSTNATVGVPFFLNSNSDDPDVRNDGGNLATDYGAYAPATPKGGMQAISALQGHHMQSTEFDSSRSYAINDGLTAPLSTDDTSGSQLLNTAGKLTNNGVKPYKKAIVGWVSKAFNNASPTLNAHGKKVLEFWSDFLPAIDSSDINTAHFN